jgi:putative membrane protein|tara:strand:- start:3553 stop:4479 length:927 start_codon:yes stop_codon:yes gene_type:complete
MRYLILYLKGMLMGAADLVPGVSGGTIALITGIYKELLQSINSISLTNLKLWKQEGLKSVWKKLNGPFLLAIFGGIFSSILLLSRILEWLIENHTLVLWSFFFGLLTASIIYLFRAELSFSILNVMYVCFGAVISFMVTQLNGGGNQTSLWYLFLSGFIGISAMILPGLSGAYILVIMGVYQTVLSNVRIAQDLILNFDQTQFINTASILGVFILGILVGIKVFAKFLSWLLNLYPQRSIAVLVGLMIGALHKVWPWQNTVGNTIKETIAVLPQAYNGEPQLVITSMWMLIGFGILFLIERSKTLLTR